MFIHQFHPTTIEALSPLEQVLYYMYKNKYSSLPNQFSPEILRLMDSTPDLESNVRGIYTMLGKDSLEEDLFIQFDSDINVGMHPRYMPGMMHCHNFYEIQYVVSGSFTQQIGIDELHLTKGDICFITPKTSHSLRINSHKTIVINIIVKSSTFQSTFTSFMGRNDIISDYFTRSVYHSSRSPYILCKTNSEEILTDIIFRLTDECQKPGKYSPRYRNAMLELLFIELLRLHEYHFTLGTSTENVNNESILAIIRYIQSNYKTTTLKDVADFFNYNETYLSRLIKKFSGQTYSEMIRTIRVQHAANLIIEGQLSIQEITDEIGYTDRSHFYRTFKKYYGVSPAQYDGREMII